MFIFHCILFCVAFCLGFFGKDFIVAKLQAVKDAVNLEKL